MKRYLLFLYRPNEPHGGWFDYYSDYDTSLKAQKAAIEFTADKSDRRFYQVVDTTRLPGKQIVCSGNVRNEEP